MAKVATPRVSSGHTLVHALAAINKKPTLFDADEWPELFAGIAESGMYAWWADATAARDLSGGIGAKVKTGCIYAGQCGATAWPAGRASRHTLQSRLMNDQLSGPVSRSTFRLTLAAALKKPLRLKKAGPSELTPASEERLSQWMREHLSLAVYQCVNRDELNDLETRVLAEGDPALNLFSMPISEVRVRISKLRKGLSGD